MESREPQGRIGELGGTNRGWSLALALRNVALTHRPLRMPDALAAALDLPCSPFLELFRLWLHRLAPDGASSALPEEVEDSGPFLLLLDHLRREAPCPRLAKFIVSTLDAIPLDPDDNEPGAPVVEAARRNETALRGLSAWLRSRDEDQFADPIKEWPGQQAPEGSR